MFKRLSNLIKGFFGLFLSGMEKKNPEALLEVEKENLRVQIGKYNDGLASHAGLCENLMAQVKKLEAQEQEYRAKASANLKAGNRELAGEYALKLQQTQKDLADRRKELEVAEQTYKELVKARDVAIAEAKRKIETLKRGIDDLKVQKAMAELNEMAAGMVTNIGGSGDTLDRLSEMVQDERNKAAGKARVARDTLNTTEFAVQESEHKALADLALADFAAQEGIALEPTQAEAAPEAGIDTGKTMGPESESTTPQ
jgi:phage shock protein A